MEDQATTRLPTPWVIGIMTLLYGGTVSGAVWATTHGWGLEVFAVAIPLLSIFTFSCLYLETGRVRHAMGGSIFLLYMALLGLGFYGPFRDVVENSAFLGDLYDQIPLTLAVVIGFYFTADVAERALTRKVPVDQKPTDASRRKAKPAKPSQQIDDV
jgi:hypothetical protein